MKFRILHPAGTLAHLLNQRRRIRPSVGFAFLSNAPVLFCARLLDTACLGLTSLPLMACNAANDAAPVRIASRKQRSNLMRHDGREGRKGFLNAFNRSCNARNKGAGRGQQGCGKRRKRLVAEPQIGHNALESVDSFGVVLPYPSVHQSGKMGAHFGFVHHNGSHLHNNGSDIYSGTEVHDGSHLHNRNDLLGETQRRFKPKTIRLVATKSTSMVSATMALKETALQSAGSPCVGKKRTNRKTRHNRK